MNPTVTLVEPLDNACLKLHFSNGEHRLFSLQAYLSKGVFSRLRDKAVFSAAKVVAGSVEWPGEIDLSYDTLYLGSIPLREQQ